MDTRETVDGVGQDWITVSSAGGIFGAWTNVIAMVGAVWLAYRVVFRVAPYLIQAFMMYVMNRVWGPTVDLRTFGTWAVVTGCTDGIGKAYVENIAAMGINVVLISRNPKKLSDQAFEIHQRYNVRTRTITADFGHQDIYDKIAIQLKGLDIGTLVNNVGMALSVPDFYDQMENTAEFIPAMINCNVSSVAMMTAIVLPGMVERKGGVIINVSSAAGCRPLPLMALYSSTKGFVNYLTEALSHEYSDKGIIFQALTPYVVSTKMSNMMETFMTPSPSAYVTSALHSLGVRSPTCGYYFHDLQHLAVSLPPLFLVKCFFLGFKKAEHKRRQKLLGMTA